jgi:hypothetical protein
MARIASGKARWTQGPYAGHPYTSDVTADMEWQDPAADGSNSGDGSSWNPDTNKVETYKYINQQDTPRQNTVSQAAAPAPAPAAPSGNGGGSSPAPSRPAPEQSAPGYGTAPGSPGVPASGTAGASSGDTGLPGSGANVTPASVAGLQAAAVGGGTSAVSGAGAQELVAPGGLKQNLGARIPPSLAALIQAGQY